MEISHKIKIVDNVEYVTLYVTYPDEYEFALDFDAFKRNVTNVSNEIKQYIITNFSKAKDSTFVLVLNGVLVGTLLLSSLNMPQTTELTPGLAQTNDQATQYEELTPQPSTQEKTVELDLKSESNQSTIPQQSTTSSTVTPTPVQTNTAVTPKATTTSSTPTPTTTTPPPSNPTPTATTGEQTINLKLSSGQVVKISVEDYVTGVVSAEMPISFNVEALKAQSVAARTFALKKGGSGATISATTSDQSYKTDAELKKMWGSSYNTYIAKIKSAVNATKGEYMVYNGKYIDALYFSTSNGKTEDPVFVWGSSVPYLKSVSSPWDVGISGYSSTKSFTISDLSKKLGVTLTSSSKMQVVDKTTGNRVKTAIFGSKTFTGVNVRSLLGLRSADFSISVSGNTVTFTTRGYGHGVGMSQYGANGMANAGSSYTQILKHYYTGINILKK